AIATIVMTVVLVIFSEVLPKSWAISSPDRFALFVAPMVRIFVGVVGPLSSAVNFTVRGLLGIFGLTISKEAPMLSAHEELRGAVNLLHREGSVIKADRDRLGGVLDLGELEVSDIMIHRTSMRAVNADDPPEVAVRAVLESPYTRMPLWRGSTDNIIGVVHAKDLLRALAEPNVEPHNLDIVKIAQKPWFVPDATNLKDQLNAFLRRKVHFAVVVDEYGEVQGIVTLEDILEEIVGDISDEHDLEIQGVRQEADGSIVVDGAVPIRDINRALDWNLPDEEATTIAGLVIHESKSIPEERQAFTFYGKRFIVMKREKNRITKLRIRPAEAADKSA
ncbi:MAG: HlyC/CorC family transporter, partial [Rhizobium sp.]